MIFQLFVTFFLVFLNGFFVAAEFAIVRVRASQIEIKVKTGSKIAKIAKHITLHLDGYLAATQLGITLASLGLGWIGEQVTEDILRHLFSDLGVSADTVRMLSVTLAPIIAFSIITVLHIVFGELAPKTVAIMHPVNTTMKIALPLHFFYLIFRPFILLLNGLANMMLKLFGIQTGVGKESHHSSEELQYLLDQGKESGALDTSEHEMIKNVFDFNERVVKNIMVPRTQICGIEINASQEQLLNVLVKEGYSRMPVYQDTIDKIVGVVHAKDVLPLLVQHQPWALKEIVRKPIFVPETKKINDLLSELQLKRIQIAIILDEFGGTAGMVTLEDIVEELVGEIQDEYDDEILIVEKVSESEFIVSALASVYDINEYLPHDLPEDGDYDTLAGLLGELFGKIPEVGERHEFHGYVFTILKKSEQNIELVRLELLMSEEDSVDLH